jgi:hypothetical protein
MKMTKKTKSQFLDSAIYSLTQLHNDTEARLCKIYGVENFAEGDFANLAEDKKDEVNFLSKIWTETLSQLRALKEIKFN